MTIYLDNNATTAPNKQMLNAASEEVSRYFGNPSSTHQAGQHAADTLYRCREQVAQAIGAKSSEIIFTSGGTESNSLVVGPFQEGLTKIISEVEHNSVANCNPDWVVQVNNECLLDLDELERIVAPIMTPVLVSVMMVNNETGTILDPHNRLFSLKKKYGFLLHVDAVQAFGKVPINVGDMSVDYLSISAHKFHGLKGAGALFVNRNVENPPNPLFVGGSHERGIRPGTENQIGIFSLGYMAEKLSEPFYKSRWDGVEARRDLLESLLSDIAEINGSKQHRVINTSNLFFPGLGFTSEVGLDYFMELLSENEVYVSGKSACSSGMPTPSRVLCKMFGDNAPQAYNSIRLSLSVDTTQEEVQRAAKVIRNCYEICKEMEK